MNCDSADLLERFGPDPLNLLRENLAEVRERIASVCARAGRPVDSVRLLPISKTVPEPILRLLCSLGIRELGENKVQEARAKAEAMADLAVRWCVVGHLQSNKAKYVARFADEFQALDSLSLAQALQERLELEGRELDVLVQVNTSGEASKFGLAPEAVEAFLHELPRFPKLRPRGFMTLALFSSDADQVRPCFERLRALRDRFDGQTPAGALPELSMGMSGDYEMAIAEGATIVRVGQGIFGRRPGSDTHYWPGLIPEPPQQGTS